MQAQEDRISITTECINSIKMIKVYVWTSIFKQIICEKRKNELQKLLKIKYILITIVPSFFIF
jgi:hypothetical protein